MDPQTQNQLPENKNHLPLTASILALIAVAILVIAAINPFYKPVIKKIDTSKETLSQTNGALIDLQSKLLEAETGLDKANF